MKKKLNLFSNDSFANLVKIIGYSFLVIACIGSAFYVINEMLSLYPKLLDTTKDTNLGLLLQSFKENGVLCFLLSLVITYLFFVFWLLLTLFFKLYANKNYLHITILCTLGILIITFIFLFLLASTKPSNNTIVFSILSAIGTAISFCYTIFINNKGNL